MARRAEKKPENQIEEKKKAAVVPIRTISGANVKPRASLPTMLAKDDEYSDLGSYVMLSEEIESNLDADVAKETKLTSLKNISSLLYMDVQGYGSRHMATQLGISMEDMQKLKRSEAYTLARDTLLREIVHSAREVMEVSALKAVKTLTECMNSTNEKVKLSAATEVLDRIGLNTTQKVEVTAKNDSMMSYSEDELMEILRTGMAESEVTMLEDVAVEVADEQ